MGPTCGQVIRYEGWKYLYFLHMSCVVSNFYNGSAKVFVISRLKSWGCLLGKLVNGNWCFRRAYCLHFLGRTVQEKHYSSCTNQPSKWRQYDLKRWELFIVWHGLTSWKAWIIINTTNCLSTVSESFCHSVWGRILMTNRPKEVCDGIL